MKRLISFSLVLMIVLVGCSKKEPEETKEPEKPKPTVITKINQDKDYVYFEEVRRETIDNPDLTYRKWQNMHDDSDPTIKLYPMPDLVKDKETFSLDKIILNFKEGDADKFNRKFEDELNETIEEERKSDEMGYSAGYTYILADYAETEKTISIIVYKDLSPRGPAGGYPETIRAYVFSKETGKLLTPDEVLGIVSLTNEKIQSDLDSSPYGKINDTSDDKTKIVKDKSECKLDGLYRHCEFARLDEGLFITTNNKLVYISERWALDGQGMYPELPSTSVYVYK